MNDKEKILYVSSNLFPLNSGAAIYSYGNIDRFSEYFTLDLVSFVQEIPSGEFYDALTQKINKFSWFLFEPKTIDFLWYSLKNRVIFQKYSKKMVQEINSLIEKNSYRYLFFDGLLTFYLLNEVQKKKDEKIILIEHNVEYLNIQEEIAYAPSFGDRIYKSLLGIGLKGFEKRSLLRSDFVLFISDHDKRNAEVLVGEKIRGFVLPPFFPFPRIKFEKELLQTNFSLLILGTMWWYPNVYGALWFINHVFPYIQAYEPRYRLFIVGKDPSKELRRHKSEAVIITGSVPSIDEYIKNCDFLIVPNNLGGGIKIKIFEGIMKGIPVLARPESILGYPAGLFPEEYLANDPEAFARMVIQQNQNPELKIKFIEQGQNKLKNYSDLSGLIKNLDESFF